MSLQIFIYYFFVAKKLEKNDEKKSLAEKNPVCPFKYGGSFNFDPFRMLHAGGGAYCSAGNLIGRGGFVFVRFDWSRIGVQKEEERTSPESL